MKQPINIDVWWRAFLRKMKERGLKIEDMPPEVAESALAIHQAALLETRSKKRKE